MIEKARGLAADEILLDLEDSVPASSKDAAREAVIAALNEGSWRAGCVSVRINALGTRWCHRDVIELAGRGGERLDALMLPKVACAEDVRLLARLCEMAELEAGRQRPLELELLIESPQGLLAAGEIAAASERVQALMLGYLDLGGALGRQRSATAADRAERWSHALEVVLGAARCAGAQAIDGPYLEILDLDGLRHWAEHVRSLGYDGKWALHPRQLPALEEVFSVGQEEVERAREVIAALERAGQHGRGSVLLDGEMIDEASRRRAQAVLARFAAGARESAQQSD